MSDLSAAFQAIGEMSQELDQTILSGWPGERCPTDEEAQAIESTFHELGLHEPDLSDSRCWYIAGQIVARIKRDRFPVGE